MAEPLYDVATLWELLDRRASASPDVPFLLDPADRRVTFAEARAWAERVAAGFVGLGIAPRAAVSWQLPTRIETVIASLALARLGAVQNPIIHIYRDREVGFALRQTGARLFLTPGEWRGFDYSAMAERIGGPQDAGRVRHPARGRPDDAAGAADRRRRDPLDLLHLGHDVGPEGRPAHRSAR